MGEMLQRGGKWGRILLCIAALRFLILEEGDLNGKLKEE